MISNSKPINHGYREKLLEVSGLKKYYDVTDKVFTKEKQYLRAVDGIDFDVYKGETLGIVGESGCGKSTTAKLILQLEELTEGTITFDNIDLNTLSKKELREKRKDFQIIFQDPVSSLNPRMKVFDIVAEPLISHKITSSKKIMREKVLELLKDVGLNQSHMDRYPHEFSGGQRQRIGIARALALKPKLIVCDEPVSALDVSIQAQILKLLDKLQEKYDLTYIFIAHGLPAIKHISNRIAVMYLGHIVEIADKEQLFNSTRHPYTEGLLSAIPVPNPNERDTNQRTILEGDIPSPVNPPSGCVFHTRCKYATEKCKTVIPNLEINEEGHSVACHYPLNS